MGKDYAAAVSLLRGCSFCLVLNYSLTQLISYVWVVLLMPPTLMLDV